MKRKRRRAIRRFKNKSVMSTFKTRKKKDEVTNIASIQKNQNRFDNNINSSDTFSDDSLLEDDNARKHKCIPALTRYQQRKFNEDNNNIIKSNINTKQQLQRATSCSYCSLCECNNSTFTDDEQLFPIRRAASCSMCDWDFEEFEGLEKISSETEEDSISSSNTFSSGSSPMKKRMSKSLSNMNYSNLNIIEREIEFEQNIDSEFESDLESGFENKETSINLDEEIQNESSEKSYVQHSTPIKRRNSYSEAVDGDSQLTVDFEINSSLRSPPDGGESCNETMKTDLNYNRVTLENKEQSINTNNEKQNENSRKIIKKTRFKNSKKKTTKSAATREFDEIFGKVSITPQSSFEQFDQQQPEIFISSDYSGSLNSSFDSNETIDRTEDSLFEVTNKTKRHLALSHLLPSNTLLRNKRKSNLNANKSKSVEVLYTNEFNSSITEGYMNKALSTLDISSGTLYYGDIIDNDSHINEKWLSYLKRIDGLTILGGNPAIRYIWHEIGTNQSDLLQPFEDFLKNMVAQLQEAYTKCQELETLISDKKVKQEKETARIYDDVEQALNDERQEMLEKQAERNEQLRQEFQNIIDTKERELEEATKLKKDYSQIIDNLRSENDALMHQRNQDEERISQLVNTETSLRKENEQLNEEINELKNQIQSMEEKICTLEEHIDQMNAISEVEKEKHQKFLIQYDDLNEEKSFLELNLKNISAELSDLKNNSSMYGEKLSFNDTDTGMVSSPNNSMNRINSFISDTDDFEYDEANTSRMQQPTYNQSINTFNTHSQTFNKQQTTIRKTSQTKFPIMNGGSETPRKLPSIFSLSPSHHVTPVKRMNQSQNASPIRLASHNQSEYKVIFVGDINVGKTSLIRRIHSGKFRANREPTVCMDFYTKEIEYNGQVAPLKMWDTLGQERFKSIPPSYFRRADVVILMYDIEEEETFLNARQWIRKIHEHTDENVVLILVGNKTDMHHKRNVTMDRGKKLARDHDAMFIETSAKNGENVAKLCQMLASTLLDREDTLIIRKDFDTSLCSLSYSQRHTVQPPCC